MGERNIIFLRREIQTSVFFKPADDNATMISKEVEYKYCKHYKCRRTIKVGFFNRTHTSSKHKFPCVDAGASVSSGVTAVTNNSTIASSVSSLGSVSVAAGNLGAVIAPAPKVTKPSMSPVPEGPGPDRLEFVGAYIADASPDDDVWMEHIMDTPSFSIAVGDVLDAEENDDWHDDIDSLPTDDIWEDPASNNFVPIQ